MWLKDLKEKNQHNIPYPLKKNKNVMIISIDAWETFDKIWYLFMMEHDGN